MSFFGKIFEKRSSGFQETGNLTDYSDFWFNAVGGSSVTSQKAMQNWAVFGCVSLLSGTMGCFPLILKKKLKGGGSENATSHPLYYLMKLQPNKGWNSTQFRTYGQESQLLQGNAISWLEKSRLGIKAIWPLDATQVSVKKGKNNERVYEVPKKGGGKKLLGQKDVLHIPGYGWDGVAGKSFVSYYAATTIGRGLAQSSFATKYFKNGIFTSGTLEHPETLGDNKQNFLNAIKAKWSGSNNTGVPLVLENGMKWNPMKLSLVDQQFIEQEKLNAEHICGMLHVPLHKLSIPGQQNSYNNTEVMNKSFLDTTMFPWVTLAEQSYDTQLLTREEIEEGYHFKFNFDHFLRPDAKARAEIAEIRTRMGIPVNRYLEKEDEEPLPWGDDGYMQLNMANVTTGEPIVDADDEGQARFSREPVERRAVIDIVDKAMNNFAPVIRASAQKVVNRETLAVKRTANKQLTQRSETDFVAWMDDFYSNIDTYIKRDLGPAIRAYWDSAVGIYLDSIGESDPPAEVEAECNEYIDGLTRNWVNESRGQIMALLKEENSYEEIILRMDEWNIKRAAKVEEQQKRSVPNAAAYLILGGFGYSLRWTNRGATCSYCRTLNGKVVGGGGHFVDGGTEITPEGKEPMLVKRKTKYPPLHRGCDCYLRAGR
jgi:HK97 family phage portal protein